MFAQKDRNKRHDSYDVNEKQGGGNFPTQQNAIPDLGIIVRLSLQP